MESGRDVLVVSIGATTGWRAAVRELVAALQRVGARVATVSTGATPEVRTFMATDFVQASAARRAVQRGLAEHPPDAIIYCSITAALLWPAPGAIWVDSIAAENRPGRHGVWQRTVERRRLVSAPLVLTMADDSLASLGGRRPDNAVTVPVPVRSSGSGSGSGAERRDVDVLAYAGDPIKRRLELILAAWQRARRGDETLVVAGIECAGEPIPGVRFVGRLAAEEYRGLLRRARVFVAAPRREDFGIAPLEALADGAVLVTTPSPGPYPALAVARALDPRLVSDELAPALRTALDDPVPGYAERAAELLEPFAPATVDATLSQRVLPRLLPGWG